jgi:hypothetical protein
MPPLHCYLCVRCCSSKTFAPGITIWLSALFLVKEENAQGDLNEGETVKVRPKARGHSFHSSATPHSLSLTLLPRAHLAHRR